MPYIIIILVFFILDIVMKYGIERLSDSKFPTFIKGTKENIKLQKSRNYGLAFGFLKDREVFTKWFPIGLTLMIFLHFLYLVFGEKYFKKNNIQRKSSILQKFSLALILAGAFSNIFDRFFRGYVVDYISFAKFPIKKIRETIFNIGDFCIIVGSILHAIFSLIKK